MSALNEIEKLPLQRLAEQITVEHQAAYGKAREALEHARTAGQLLIEAKASLGHGEWLPWLAANFEFTARTAQGYMRIAERWSELEAKNETVSHLGLREALGLLAAPQALEIHKYGQIFPRMRPHEFEGLKQSIKAGFLEHHPITLYEGKILDGKERYRACLELGIEPRFETYEDRCRRTGYRGSPLAFVWSANFIREHLTDDQRVAIAVEAELLITEEQRRTQSP